MSRNDDVSILQIKRDGYLPFLPADNRSLKDPAAEEAIAAISEDLGNLLRLPSAAFWEVLSHATTLRACLDSYLQFKRRVYDEDDEGVSGASAASQLLERRVFMTLLRMTTPNAADGLSGPCPAQQAEILYNKWLLDVPKIMDICALYGATNRSLVQQLCGQLMALQPRYLDDIAAVAPVVVQNLREVADTSCRLARLVAQGDTRHAPNLLETARYLQDTSLTLLLFMQCCQPAAALLLGIPSGGSALLTVLASIHDGVLPQMLRALQQPAASEVCQLDIGGQDALRRMQQLRLCLQRVTFELLRRAFLEGASAGGPAANGKPLPTKDAAARGDDVMSLLISVTQPGEGDDADGASSSARGVAGGAPQLLAEVNTRFGLTSALAYAHQQGIIAIDDAPLDYLLSLIGEDRAVFDAALRQPPAGAPSKSMRPPRTHAHSAGTNGNAGAGPSSAAAPKPLDLAAAAAALHAVKDVLPEYGDGFITACLESCQYRAEQVIAQLLEGSLPPHLDALDRQLATWPPPSASGKGKARLAAREAEAAAAEAPASMPSLSWSALAAAAASDTSAGPSTSSASSATVPAGRKPAAVHRGTARMLGRMEDSVRSRTLGLADELQWEYDDEYDDSFDDLNNNAGADGQCEAEGDDVQVRPGPSRFSSSTDDGLAGSSSTASGGFSDARRAVSGRARTTGGGGAGGGSAGPLAQASTSHGPGGGGTDDGGQTRTPAASGASNGVAGAARRPDQGARPPQLPGDRGAGPAGTAAGGAAAAAAAAAMAAASLAVGRPGPAASSSGAAGASTRAPTQLHPTGSGPPAQRSAQQQKGGKGGRGGGKQWVLDGRIYNYAKEGAVEAGNQQEVDRALTQHREAQQEIMGLGPGGNRPDRQLPVYLRVTTTPAGSNAPGRPDDQHDSSHCGNDEHEEEGSGQDGHPGSGSGRGGGRSTGRGGYARKEQNKAAIGNHHRKDRALRKMGPLG